MDDTRFDLLEQALLDMESGVDSSEILSANPTIRAELEAAELARQLFIEEPAPAAAQRSRTRLLARAYALRKKSPFKTGFLTHKLRLGFALTLAVVLVLAVSGFSAASAQALPGDQLYNAKLTLEKIRLGFALNPQIHQKVEEEYESRRVDEVHQLLNLGKMEFIQFNGIVEQQREDYWIIAGIEVRLSPDVIILGEIVTGMMVEVEGATQPDGWVLASEIHLQSFTITGAVESMTRTAWIISGREVRISSGTQISSGIEVGDAVIAEVDSDDFGILTAKKISQELAPVAVPQPTEIPQPLVSPEKAATDTPVPTATDNQQEETQSTNEAEENEESPESEETDEVDEIDGPDISNETDEADESDEPDESKETAEPGETREPTETEETEEPEKPQEEEHTETVEPTETPEPEETDEIEAPEEG